MLLRIHWTVSCIIQTSITKFFIPKQIELQLDEECKVIIIFRSDLLKIMKAK